MCIHTLTHVISRKSN